MLANDPTNPRPRPPAQVRRSTSGMKKSSSSSSSSPPPPYASSLAFPRRSSTSATLLGSPVSATVQMVDGGSQEMVEWLNEKSREELSELLLKADGVIKQRESGRCILFSHVTFLTTMNRIRPHFISIQNTLPRQYISTV